MPTCDPSVISHITNEIFLQQPLSILDIGIGCGKWGFLSREYADRDFFCHVSDYSRLLLHGIEIFQKYIGSIQSALYNRIHIGDALDILSTGIQMKYDLIIMCDVLEHFSKIDGHNLLKLIRSKAKRALITTPNIWLPQLGFHENIHEKHLSFWSVDELQAYGITKQFGILTLLEMNS